MVQRNYYIYVIKNIVTDKVYVGKSIDPDNRWKEHLRNAFKYNFNNKLHNALRKYGVENFKFEVIDNCSTISEINILERRYIQQFNSFYSGYNSTFGGDGGNTFLNCTNEQYTKRIEKLKESKRNSMTTELRLVHSNNTKTLWTNSEYRTKVTKNVREYYSNQENKLQHSKRMKQICNTTEARLVRSKNSSGKNNRSWLGYCLILKDENLISIYETFSILVKDANINKRDQFHVRTGSRKLVLTSTDKKFCKYEGCTLVISKTLDIKTQEYLEKFKQ